MDEKIITIGHSPDADDAFMFYALTHDKLPITGIKFEHVLTDIETLNKRAMRKGNSEQPLLDITAASLHAYPYIARDYQILSCGASMGKGYGPIVVSKDKKLSGNMKVAVPGEYTSALLALKMCMGNFRYTVMPFDKIMPAVKNGEVSAGLIIHEGQITYADDGLNIVVDLGKWWLEKTGLPLPLGINLVKRSLDEGLKHKVNQAIKDSIAYGFKHEDEAMTYAAKYSRGLDMKRVKQFALMYVNDYTLEPGKEGRAGIQEFIKQAANLKLIPDVEVTFIS
ncbi:MAG: ABC transporter substrate-binding protein [Deltaproteobacteria bacterium]|nr:ABC transporter substrate-binding protein [Deltaproteobacteria bacterium]